MTLAHLMRPDLSREIHRAAVLAAIAWLPLLLLSILEGSVLGVARGIPFLYDVTTAIRFLISVPMLVIAERVVEARSMVVARNFIESSLVRKRDYLEFGRILRQVASMRNSVLAEVAIVLLVIVGVLYLKLDVSSTLSSWQFVDTNAGPQRSLAGWWDVIVSIPIFQFLLARWLWRYLIWCWFLWRMSRMDLRLFPTHPDGAAGLGFLSIAQTKFWAVIAAFSAILSANGATTFFLGRAVFGDYRYILIGYVALVLIVFVGPLFIFSTKLFAVKTKGLLEYGNLAHEYVWLFHRKWVKREAADSEAIIGSADIQSLADLGNSFDVVRRMRLAPFDLKTTVIPLVLATLVPFAPWVAMLVPIDELFEFLLGVL
ncbi:MAG: hypothetical protein AB7S71_24345 [Dongiaceae bacterium]